MDDYLIFTQFEICKIRYIKSSSNFEYGGTRYIVVFLDLNYNFKTLFSIQILHLEDVCRSKYAKIPHLKCISKDFVQHSNPCILCCFRIDNNILRL